MKLPASIPGANGLARACAKTGPAPVCGDLGDVCIEPASSPQEAFAQGTAEISLPSPPPRSLPEPRPAAARRRAEEMAPSCWHVRSTRDDSLVTHSEETSFLAGLSDRKLALRLGYARKHKHRGLSEVDLAAQDEWRARALGFAYLYGRDREPVAQAWLLAELSELGFRSHAAIARRILGLLELAIVKGRNGLCLSAPDYRVLYGGSLSSFWVAVARLEEEGVLERVEMSKPHESGRGPKTHRDANCYVPGPWLRKRIPAVLGVQGRCQGGHQQEGQHARAALRGRLKARRRLHMTHVRDRNRERLHGLDPLLFTTPSTEHAVDLLAMSVVAAAERCVDERVRSMFEGGPVELGASLEDAYEPFLTAEAEQAFGASLEQYLGAVNGGLPESLLKLELPSGFLTALPDREKLNQREGDPEHSHAGSKVPDHPENGPTTERLAVQRPGDTDPRSRPTDAATKAFARDEHVALEGEGLARSGPVVDSLSFRSPEHPDGQGLSPPRPSPPLNTRAQPPPPPQAKARGPTKELSDEEISALFAEVISGSKGAGWSRDLF